MDKNTTDSLLDEIVSNLDIPENAYKKAEERYESIYEWLTRPGAISSRHDPDVYPQGSFRLGTVVRPLDPSASFDLDIGCRLLTGISVHTHTQHQLKELVGKDLDDYRKARLVKEELEEKTRCWRLQYADQLSFHMDCVPSIPQEQTRIVLLEGLLMNRENFSTDLAQEVTATAGAITDNTRDDYDEITPEWYISNSQGYAKWFESRMRQAIGLLENRAINFGRGSIEEIPTYDWKSPLQAAIQLFKRHRDVMYRSNDESKPISVIITTLAARAYEGQSSLRVAIDVILNRMESLVSSTAPMVPNPVNPEEDFADKWYSPSHAKFRLRESFIDWVRDAKRDFKKLFSVADSKSAQAVVKELFDIDLSKQELEKLGFLTATTGANEAPFHISTSSPRPWLNR